jgi:hypothetical protein
MHSPVVIVEQASKARGSRESPGDLEMQSGLQVFIENLWDVLASRVMWVMGKFRSLTNV